MTRETEWPPCARCGERGNLEPSTEPGAERRLCYECQYARRVRIAAWTTYVWAFSVAMMLGVLVLRVLT